MVSWPVQAPGSSPRRAGPPGTPIAQLHFQTLLLRCTWRLLAVPLLGHTGPEMATTYSVDAAQLYSRTEDSTEATPRGNHTAAVLPRSAAPHESWPRPLCKGCMATPPTRGKLQLAQQVQGLSSKRAYANKQRDIRRARSSAEASPQVEEPPSETHRIAMPVHAILESQHGTRTKRSVNHRNRQAGLLVWRRWPTRSPALPEVCIPEQLPNAREVVC